ncbi:hypothetical protein C7820_6663 [Paenibacillus sp. VMFN-D1]|nr:hypothetical protein C7820_6663 [Paenibacillus sp. VMFN-D1]
MTIFLNILYYPLYLNKSTHRIHETTTLVSLWLLIHLLHNIPQMISEIFQSKERNEQEDHRHTNRHNHSFKGHFYTPFLIRIINHSHEGQQASTHFFVHI